MSWGNINRRKGILNERKVLRAIKTFPKVGEYYEVSYVTLANKTGIARGSISYIIKRLERKNLIEVKESFALFGSMLKKGIKILEEANESLA